MESHTLVALGAGLSTDEVRSLRADDAVDVAFPAEDERALIGWCDAMVATGPGRPAGDDARLGIR